MFELLRFPSDFLAGFDRLHRELDQWYSSVPFGIRASGLQTFPTVNVGSTPDTVEIYALVPGVDPATLEVSVDRGLLTIAGERKSTLETGHKQNVYAQERFIGSFRRVISLPEDVDPSKLQAHCENGVLHITAGRLETSKPHRIQVH